MICFIRPATCLSFSVGACDIYSVEACRLRTLKIFTDAGRVFSVDEIEICITEKYGGEAVLIQFGNT